MLTSAESGPVPRTFYETILCFLLKLFQVSEYLLLLPPPVIHGQVAVTIGGDVSAVPPETACCRWRGVGWRACAPPVRWQPDWSASGTAPRGALSASLPRCSPCFIPFLVACITVRSPPFSLRCVLGPELVLPSPPLR